VALNILIMKFLLTKILLLFLALTYLVSAQSDDVDGDGDGDGGGDGDGDSDGIQVFPKCKKCKKLVLKFIKKEQFTTKKKRKKCKKKCTEEENEIEQKLDGCSKKCCKKMCKKETPKAACIKTNFCAPLPPPVLRLTAVSDKGSSDRCDGEDWIELTNTGDTKIDLKGYILHDDKGPDDLEAFIFGAAFNFSVNTIEAGANITRCKNATDSFLFGIGGDDKVTLRDVDRKKVDSSGKLGDQGEFNYVWTRGSPEGDWSYVWINGTVIDVDE